MVFKEICIANACYDLNDNLLWQSTIIGDYGHWSAIFDADGDAEGEVAMIGQGLLGIYDPDGTPLVLTNAGTGQPGPPCWADFDGDGTAGNWPGLPAVASMFTSLMEQCSGLKPLQMHPDWRPARAMM